MATILVADDNQTFAELVGALLEDDGHEVVTAFSGLAAIRVVDRHPIDAAVLDVLIPEISGDAVAARLRQALPGLPIVLMTGADTDFAKGAGLPVLRKPFTKEELIDAVQRSLGTAR